MGEMEENGSLTRRGRGEDKHNNEKRGGANPRLEMKRQRHASPPRCHYRAICVHYSSMPTPHLKKTHNSHKNSNTAAASSPTFCGTSGKAGIYLREEEKKCCSENALKKEEEEEE